MGTSGYVITDHRAMKYVLLCFVWMCMNVSCKKQAASVSPDHIEFSLNDSLPATCSLKVRIFEPVQG